MQNTSSSYLLEIKQPSRLFECRVTIGDNIYTNTDVINMTIDDVQPGEGFSIGAAVSKSLELTLSTTNIIYSNSIVKVEIGLVIGSKTEYILMGYFNIDDIEKTDYSIKLTCFDNMMKFEKPYFSKLGKTSSLTNIVNELAQITGVEFTGSLPSYNLNKLEGFTCREILGFVAGLCAGNAYITRDGKFTIKTPKQVDYSITDENYINYKKEDIYKIGAVTCHGDEKELTKGTLSNSTMEVAFENPWVNDSILTDIYNKLKGFEYVGYSMKWQGDLSLDVGDIISLTDNKGITSKIPILSQKLNYNGGLTSEIGAKGESKNKNEFNSAGNLNNKVNRVVSDLLLVNKALINKADIEDLKVVNADIENLIAENVTITGKLNAVEGEFGTLKANVGVIDELTVTHTAQINDLKTNSATITQLNVVSASIGTLESKVGRIGTLINGNLTSDNIQSLILSSSKVTVENGFIKNAMIDNLDVSKINAGDISTNKFRIKSDDGGIEIVGSTQQFKDKNNKVRIQIGQDAQGNFNFIVIGEDGTSTLIDHTGVKEKAIANDLIKNNMIASDAVGEKQINYSSFITGFNKDDNTSTIKSTKIMLNNQNQTLDVAFNQLKTQADGTKSVTESHSTSIGIIQGQVSALISDTTIEENGSNTKIKDAYANLKVNVDGISTKVSKVESDFNNMEIGGRNYLVGTKTEAYVTTTTTEGFMVQDPYITHNYQKLSTYGIKANDSLAVSFNWEIIEATTYGNFRVELADDSEYKGGFSEIIELSPSNTKGHFVGILTLDDTNITASALRIRIDNSNLTLKISEAKLEKGNKPTAHSQAPEDTDMDIQGVKDNLVKNYSTTSAMNSAIDQKESGILLAVSNTYATKGTVTDLNDNLSRNYSTTSAMNTAINQKADDITQSVSRTYTTKNEFHNASNQNLLNNSDFKILDGDYPKGWYVQDTSKIGFDRGSTTLDGVPTFYYHVEGLTDNQYSAVCSPFISAKAGEKFVASVYVSSHNNWETLDAGGAIEIEYYPDEDVRISVEGVSIDPNLTGWQRLVVTGTAPQGTTRVRIRVHPIKNGHFNMSKPMLQYGDIVTGWSPGLDIYDISSRMQTAESKLTKDSLTTTIGDHYTTGTDVNGIVTSKGYQTQSQVQQTVNVLEAKFTSSGGYNLLRNSAFYNRQIDNWWLWGDLFIWDDAWYYSEYGDMYIANNTQSAGGLWQNSIPMKPNTTYTLSVITSMEKNVYGSRFIVEYCDNIECTNQFSTTAIPMQNSNVRQSYTFTTPNDSRIKYAKLGFTHDGSTGDGAYILLRINKPCLTTGTVAVWSPHPNEIYDGITRVDRDGITVTASNVKSKTSMSANGFKITKTDTNQDVFKVKSDGTLSLVGEFISYNGGKKSGYFGLDTIKFYNWKSTSDEEIAWVYGGISSSGKLTLDLVGKDMVNLGVGGMGTSGTSCMQLTDKEILINKEMQFDNWGMEGVNHINYIKNKDLWINDIYIRANQINTNKDSGYINLNYWMGEGVTGKEVTTRVCSGNNNADYGKLLCGDFKAYGTKNACVQTSVGYVDINAYETAEYYFGDIGETILDEDGYSYVYIEPIFKETINTSVKYQVFLSVYGEGMVNVIDRTPNYFVLKGTPGIEVGYEIKAKRKGYEDYRLERESNSYIKGKEHGLDAEYQSEKDEFNEQLETAVYKFDLDSTDLQFVVDTNVQSCLENIELINMVDERIKKYENIN